MNNCMKINRALKILIISIAVLSFSFFCYFYYYKSKENHGYKSEFYQLYFTENDSDFIKFGEDELRNIDKYLEIFKDDILFSDFLSSQKRALYKEITEKKSLMGKRILLIKSKQ